MPRDSQLNASDAAYVVDQVRTGDRDRFLAALFAPPDRRADLFALYAFNVEIAKIPQTVSEPLVGRMRIQWWRDTLSAISEGRGAPAGQPIAQAFADTINAFGLARTRLEALLLSVEAELDDDEGYGDLDAMEAHAGNRSVPLAWLAFDVLGIGNETSKIAARHVAVGHTLSMWLRSLPLHLGRGRVKLPEESLTHAGISVAGIESGRDRDALRAVVRQVAERAERHLQSAKTISQPLGRGGMAVLLWSTAAKTFLHSLYAAEFDVFDRRVASHRTGILPLLWRYGLGRI